MKTTISLLILACACAYAQRSFAAAAPAAPPAPAAPAAPVAPPPSGPFAPTIPRQTPDQPKPSPDQPQDQVNVPTTQPAPGTNVIIPGDTNVLFPNQFTSTNQFGAATNPAFFSATNGFGATNAFNGTDQPGGFAITNTLSTMSPIQAQAVRRVQVALDALQRAAANLRSIPNVQQTIDQSPQLQQQLQAVASQINALAQGPIRPSQFMVMRLSRDLVRVYAVANLTPDQQLVLSTVINQIANSATLSAAQVDESIGTAEALLQSGGVQNVSAVLVTSDLRALALEMQRHLVR